MNITILEGHITADSEVKGDENKYCRFTIAVNDGWGEKKKTYFIPCVSFGKTAEFMGNYVSKGDLISLAGTLTQNQWEDKDGNKRSSFSVSCSQVNLLKKKEAKSTTDKVEDTFQNPFSDDDIPF